MKSGEGVHSMGLGNVLLGIFVLMILFCVWKGIRRFSSVSCQKLPELPAAAYGEQERVMDAIALSYLVYGCENRNGLSGRVSQILAEQELGIVQENFGIIRADRDDPASALFDTGDFIRKAVGEFRFLLDRKDEKSGFYGAAFCDDAAKCVWIAYTGSVSFRDAVACAELVLVPGLSAQEKQAIALYEAVLQSAEVQEQSYSMLLTGHSLGGSLASMVACASGCRAVTVNGADGIMVNKFRDMEGEQENHIVNYLTSPWNGKLAFLNLVQCLMFLGDNRAVETHVYPANACTTDTHCVFSFLVFADDGYGTPRLP